MFQLSQVYSGRCGSVTGVTAPSGPVRIVGRRLCGDKLRATPGAYEMGVQRGLCVFWCVGLWISVFKMPAGVHVHRVCEQICASGVYLYTWV